MSITQSNGIGSNLLCVCVWNSKVLRNKRYDIRGGYSSYSPHTHSHQVRGEGLFCQHETQSCPSGGRGGGCLGRIGFSGTNEPNIFTAKLALASQIVSHVWRLTSWPHVLQKIWSESISLWKPLILKYTPLIETSCQLAASTASTISLDDQNYVFNSESIRFWCNNQFKLIG